MVFDWGRDLVVQSSGGSGSSTKLKSANDTLGERPADRGTRATCLVSEPSTGGELRKEWPVLIKETRTQSMGVKSDS